MGVDGFVASWTSAVHLQSPTTARAAVTREVETEDLPAWQILAEGIPTQLVVIGDAEQNEKPIFESQRLTSRVRSEFSLRSHGSLIFKQFNSHDYYLCRHCNVQHQPSERTS